MSYKLVLKGSQLQYVEDIVSQIPEAMGARSAFEAILDDLAMSAPTFRFYIVATEMGEVIGTDDAKVAKGLAQSEENFVIDTSLNKWIQEAGFEHEIEPAVTGTSDEEDDGS